MIKIPQADTVKVYVSCGNSNNNRNLKFNLSAWRGRWQGTTRIRERIERIFAGHGGGGWVNPFNQWQ